ncbi:MULTISPECIES: 30S ribosomal protein S12 methylthiotransferase RimO [unclassified Janibacter]|uniref:30S ribosomal protein S12 methylthiotransferase RimO n=1 Tax=unclassified Janibacter TaxID=2649294 RepID=UPI003CFFB544
MTTTQRSVALVTLGCTRNEVDSEELAGRLQAEGWLLVDDAADADVAVVNTCGFIEQAKKDSIDTILEASQQRDAGGARAVVAVGCLAERYGQELADELPEADAVLGFDSYADMSSHLRSILDGHKPASHTPSDRRQLLPLSPVDRRDTAGVAVPGHGDLAPEMREPAAPSAADAAVPAPASGPRVMRARLDGRPWAPLKIASGCDRRCSFCAIPMFRGAFLSRRPTDVIAEARWLAERGVKELFLVSENSTSYGKDLGDLGLLETMLPELGAIDGIERVRVSYLQPAEIRPGLLHAMATVDGVVPWYDISFQHASGPLLRRMRRFGDRESFLDLIERIRAVQPTAGIRSNVILGFPGETEEDVEILVDFLVRARLDVVGVFGYSDEDGTEAEGLGEKVDPDVIAERVRRVQDLVEELTAQRAEERIGEEVVVLVEEIDEETGDLVGRAAHQGPDVDGVTILTGTDAEVGDLVPAVVTGTEGIDLIAEAS